MTTPRRMPLTAIKSAVRPGQRYWVTNHRITDLEAVAYGTTLRAVETASSGGFLLSLPAGCTDDITPMRYNWPRAALIDMDPDGTIRIYADGQRQPEGDLFLTLKPAGPAAGLPFGHALTIAQFTGITDPVTLDVIEEIMRHEQPLLGELTRTGFAVLARRAARAVPLHRQEQP